MPKGGAREGTGPKRRCTEQCQFSHRLAEWQALCGRAITNMVCCGFCGYVALGNANLKQWTQLPIASLSATLQPAPYAIMNGFMAQHVMHSPSTFHVCPVCKIKHARAKRALHTVLMDPAYVEKLLGLPCLDVQLLSVVDVSIAFQERWNCMAAGELVNRSVLDGALVTSGAHIHPNVHHHLKSRLTDLLMYNLESNPIIQQFYTMLELPVPKTGFPLMPAAAIQDIIGDARARGPSVDSYPAAAVDTIIAALVDVSPPVPRQLNPNITHNIGILHHRDNHLLVRPLHLNHLGVPPGAHAVETTAETAIFPFLFPGNTGHYNGRQSLCQYLEQRIRACLSVFTLYRPYLMIMYLLKHSSRILNDVRSSVLDASIRKFERTHPDKSREDAFRAVLKHNVSLSIPGTPGWHKSKLEDLKAMVRTWGIPHGSLTLTCDEVSPTRWQEITDLEAFLATYNSSLRWTDAPVECALIFHTRMQTLMAGHINSRGIFGKVLHHVTRYECQARGSLHAHVILWLDSTGGF